MTDIATRIREHLADLEHEARLDCCPGNESEQFVPSLAAALRAVLELHQARQFASSPNWCPSCRMTLDPHADCPTVSTIAESLGISISPASPTGSQPSDDAGVPTLSDEDRAAIDADCRFVDTQDAATGLEDR